MNFQLGEFIVAVLYLSIIGALAYMFYKSYRKTDEDEINNYELGLKYIVEDKSRKAIEYLKEAIRKDSNNVDAYVKLGNILRDEGAAKNALRVHKDLILRTDLNDSDRYNVLKSLADDMLVLKQDEKARQFLEQIKTIYKNDDYAINELLKSYENNSDYAKAIQLLEQNKDIEINDRDVRLAMYKVILGLAKVEKGKEKDARILYKDALKANSKCEAAYILMGDSYLREGRSDDAIEKWLECATEIPDKSHFVFERLEKAWFEKGEFYKMEDFYNNILNKLPKNRKAIIALSEIKAKKGEYGEANLICEDYLKKNPDDELIQVYSLRYLVKNNEMKKASTKMLEYFNTYFAERFHNYTCTVCENEADEPLGKCPKCGQWGKYL